MKGGCVVRWRGIRGEMERYGALRGDDIRDEAGVSSYVEIHTVADTAVGGEWRAFVLLLCIDRAVRLTDEIGVQSFAEVLCV